MADDPKKETEDPTLALLREAMEFNGHTPSAKRDKALFTVLEAIYLKVLPLPKRIEHLEDKSIIIWAEKHKAFAATIITVLAFVGMTFHDLYPRIVEFLALIDPFR